MAPPPPVPLAAPPTAPLPSGAFTLPPGGFPKLPPNALPPQVPSIAPQPGSMASPPPNSAPPSISNSPPDGAQQQPPRVETQWQAAEAREAPPKIETNRDTPPRVNLYAPEAIDKDAPKQETKDNFNLEPPRVDKERAPAIETPQKKPGVQPAFPAIPQFAIVKDNVFAGLRPPLDGLDWLQTNGVKTVVQLRLFGEDDSADRKQVEIRNMRYIPFEVSPQTLTKAKVDEFIQLVRDGSKQQIFVYDQNGSLAGAMWYLYLRMGENIDDDASQLRARNLGLQANRDGAHRDMWLAVQKLLSER